MRVICGAHAQLRRVLRLSGGKHDNRFQQKQP